MGTEEKVIQAQPKWRSKYLWLSIIALGIFVGKTYFNFEIPKVNELVDLILVVVTGLGIFNDSGNATAW